MNEGILYVGFGQDDEWIEKAVRYAEVQKLLEKLGRQPCLVVPYTRATPGFVRRLQPRAIVMSGFGRSLTLYSRPQLRGVAELMLDPPAPTLCICGSHQLLAMVYDGTWQGRGRLRDWPMRKRRPDEPCINPDYHPEYYMERGFHPVRLLRRDPLFRGLRRVAWFSQAHYGEVKRLPSGFTLLASTPECRIQAMRHRRLPLVGVQFHPESANADFPDGWRLLENFLGTSGLPGETPRRKRGFPAEGRRRRGG